MTEEQMAKLGGQLDDLGFDPHDIDAVQAAIRSVLRESKPVPTWSESVTKTMQAIDARIAKLEADRAEAFARCGSASSERGGAKG
jgi:hypothetical protein